MSRIYYLSLVFESRRASAVMNKIIKRLEIVKSAIELEDEEIIHQQLAHLKDASLDAAIGTIALAIEERRFGDAMREIAA